MLKSLCLLLILAASLAFGTYAQEDEQWFFAEDPDNSQIIAYNLEGEVVPVMDVGEDANLRSSWRIDSQTLLSTFEDVDGNLTMVRLSPDGANPIPHTFEMAVRVVSYSYPFVVFMPVEPMRVATPVVLVNVEEGTTTSLREDVAPIIEAFPCCRFSEDGTRLRYIAKIQLDEANPQRADFMLRERDLTTGQVTTIFTILSYELNGNWTVSGWQPDSTGDRWLLYVNRRNNSARIRETWLVTLDDAAEMLDETSTDAGAVPVYRFWNDLMWVTDAICDGGCQLEVFDEAGDPVISVQNDPEYFIQQLVYLGDGYIIAAAGEMYLRLSPDSDPEIIGYRDFSRLVGDIHTPDGRLAVLLAEAESDSPQVFIRDNVTGENIYTREFEDLLYAFNSVQGRWLRTYISARIDGGIRDIYVIVDQESGDLAEVILELGTVAQILSLDEVIVWRPDREAGTNRLLIHNTATGEETLLLEGNYRPFDGKYIADAVWK